MKGRPPKPMKLHILDGTYREDRHGDISGKPCPLGGLPKCPRDLSKEAKKIWKEIIRTMGGSGVFSQADVWAMKRYCTAVARIDEAETLINQMGIKQSISEIGRAALKQLYVILRGETAEMNSLGAQLGLTPVSRTRLSVAPAKSEVENPKDRFFKAQG